MVSGAEGVARFELKFETWRVSTSREVDRHVTSCKFDWATFAILLALMGSLQDFQGYLAVRRRLDMAAGQHATGIDGAQQAVGMEGGRQAMHRVPLGAHNRTDIPLGAAGVWAGLPADIAELCTPLPMRAVVFMNRIKGKRAGGARHIISRLPPARYDAIRETVAKKALLYTLKWQYRLHNGDRLIILKDMYAMYWGFQRTPLSCDLILLLFKYMVGM